VILYADKKTDSMTKAIDETKRRRNIQEQFNKKNNITPTSIKRDISDILESIYENDRVNVELLENEEKHLVGNNLKKHLEELKKKMLNFAEDLNFEEAAKLRDEIKRLENNELELPSTRSYSYKKKKRKKYFN